MLTALIHCIISTQSVSIFAGTVHLKLAKNNIRMKQKVYNKHQEINFAFLHYYVHSFLCAYNQGLYQDLLELNQINFH